MCKKKKTFSINAVCLLCHGFFNVNIFERFSRMFALNVKQRVVLSAVARFPLRVHDLRSFKRTKTIIRRIHDEPSGGIRAQLKRFNDNVFNAYSQQHDQFN